MKTKDHEQILTHIRSDAVNKDLNLTHQNRHIPSSGGYIEGRSFIYDDVDPKALIDRYHGTGSIRFSESGKWVNKEFITLDRDIGVQVEQLTGIQTPTNSFSIHYSKKGAHVVPSRRQANVSR